MGKFYFQIERIPHKYAYMNLRKNESFFAYYFCILHCKTLPLHRYVKKTF
jgi:hypothetical protein